MSRALRFAAGVAVGLPLLLAGIPARAADEDTIKAAIQRGVGVLKQKQKPDGSWAYQYHITGATALAALTLLECDVEADDPAIQKATKVIRQSCIECPFTYEISLAIMFFDRLGKAEDLPLIEALTARLVRGQTPVGGWSYTCPVDPGEVRKLSSGNKGGEGQAGGAGGAADATPPVGPGGFFPQQPQQGDDNSNTQFATLALWVSRRHKFDVDRALKFVEQRFRRTQHPDGGWGYLTSGGFGQPSTASMTCAGLLGMAVAYGVATEAVLRSGLDFKPSKDGGRPRPQPTVRDPNRDPVVKGGLLALGNMIANQYAKAGAGALGAGGPGAPPPGPLQAARGGQERMGANMTDYYLLWSLERVAMAFSLKTIGKKDWYNWGCDIILQTESGEGGWRGRYSDGGVDTCFALLFLRRSNLVRDLTDDLKDKIRDPAERSLKAGGVGGDELLNRDVPADNRTEVKQRKEGSIPELNLDGRPGESGGGDKSSNTAGGAGNSDASNLSAQLINGSPADRASLLRRLREEKGVANTQALALAIPRLNGAIKQSAREALAERMTRMTAGTLKDKLQDEDLEVRRAAALACAMREEKGLMPELIKLLEDVEPPVSRAARASLKSLSGQDFGPSADASRAERKEAIARWKEWWTKNGQK